VKPAIRCIDFVIFVFLEIIMDTHLLPINKTAALVVSNGTHFVPTIKPNPHDERETCPQIRAVTCSFDITGLKSGWLTVVGLSAEKKDRWVCRCVCGRYVFRTAKSLRRVKAVIDKCIHCNKLDHLKFISSHIRGGI
jgi:hypothetical protein